MRPYFYKGLLKRHKVLLAGYDVDDVKTWGGTSKHGVGMMSTDQKRRARTRANKTARHYMKIELRNMETA